MRKIPLLLLLMILFQQATNKPAIPLEPNAHCLAPFLNQTKKMNVSTAAGEINIKAYKQILVHPEKNELEDTITDIARTIHAMFNTDIIVQKPLFDPTFNLDLLEEMQNKLFRIAYSIRNTSDEKQKATLLAQHTTLENQLRQAEQRQALNNALYFLIENAIQHGWANTFGHNIPVEIGISNQELIVRISSPHRKDAKMPDKFIDRPLTGDMEEITQTYTSAYSGQATATMYIADLFLDNDMPPGSFIFYSPSPHILAKTDTGAIDGTLFTYVVIPLLRTKNKDKAKQMQAVKSAFSNVAFNSKLLFSAA